MNATTLDLRYRTREVLSSLDRGESVVITFRGKPRGVIAPYRETTATKVKSSILDHPFIGMWAGSETTVDDEMSRLRRGRIRGRDGRVLGGLLRDRKQLSSR